MSVTQSIDTSTPAGRLLRNMMLEFAQFEREMIADRTRDKMEQRAQKGLWNGGIPPYGYTASDKKLVEDAKEASRVRYMFEWFAENPSLAKLRVLMDQRAWQTRSGTRWGKTSLANILRNPIYCGKVRFGDELYPGLHAPLVSEALFQRAQTHPKDQSHPKTRQDRPYILKGLLKCADCGSFMTPHYTAKRRKDGSVCRTPYYRCTKTMHFDNSVCRTKHVNADLIEDTVINDIADLSAKGSLLDACVEDMNRHARTKAAPLEKERKRLKRRINEIETELDTYVKSLGKAALSLERLERAIANGEKEKEALQIQLDDVERQINDEITRDFNVDIVRRHLQNFRGAFDSLTGEEKSQALQCILKDIVLHPDKIVLNIFEIPESAPGSQNRTDWLPGLDSNLAGGTPPLR